MKKSAETSVFSIIVKNTFTYFNTIFLVVPLLLVLAEAYRSLSILIIYILIGVFQQLRDKEILDELTLIAESKYEVLREGKKLDVDMNHLM